MRLQRIQEMIFHHPWLITASGHEAIRGIVERKLSTDPEVAEQRAGWLDELVNPRPAASLDGEIGHVYITGAIGVGLSKIEKTCGNTDTIDLMAEVRDLRASGARRLMAHVDSPGGTVGGVAEAANELADLDIPWFCYIGPGALDCSAAYWLTAGADRIYASDTAQIGSIGVYLPWIDRSAYYERLGYKIDLIRNKEGDLKGAGYPGTSLSEQQRADWQEGTQQVFDAFAAHVRESRGKIADDTMRGQSFWAAEAYKRNLIDGVASYEAALRSLKGYSRES